MRHRTARYAHNELRKLRRMTSQGFADLRGMMHRIIEKTETPEISETSSETWTATCSCHRAQSDVVACASYTIS